MMGMTVVMKSYIGRDSGHDGEEGVTPGINKCAECDSDNKSYQKRDSGNDGEEGATLEINKCEESDSDHKKLP
jgi:hypothetical protein